MNKARAQEFPPADQEGQRFDEAGGLISEPSTPIVYRPDPSTPQPEPNPKPGNEKASEGDE